MTAVCEGCGEAVEPSRGGGARKWCSERCRRRSLYGGVCVDCGARTCGGRGPGRASIRCGACVRTTMAWRSAHSGGRERTWADEDLVGALRACHQATGPPVTQKAYDAWAAETDAPSRALIVQRLDTWSRACEAAGVECGNQYRTSYEHTTAEQCVAAVVQATRITGRPPTVAEYTAMRRDRPGLGWPSVALVRIRCGTWLGALRAAEMP